MNDTYSEEYRRLCEARAYLATPDHLHKHYISRVIHFRGDAAAQRLLEDVAEIRLKTE